MKKIVKLLIDNGYDAYIVGGYVRDYLLGIDSKDIDICTNASIKDIKKIFGSTGQSYDEYYSYHIKKDNKNFDITSYRKELSYKKNKPNCIKPAKTLKEDLLRRDFTINTFAISSDGKLIDLLNAKADLNSKLIKVVGDTNKKLKEDRTRIIRALRFMCCLDFDLHPDILKFLKNNHSNLLVDVPLDYIKMELDKIFDSNNYGRFFYILKRYSLYDSFNIKCTHDINKTYNRYGIWSQLETTLPLSKKENKIIKNINLLLDKNDINFNDVCNYSDDVIYNAAYILGIESKVKTLKELKSMQSIIDIDISIDVLLKYVKIENIKHVYKNINENIISGKLNNDEESIIKYLRSL